MEQKPGGKTTIGWSEFIDFPDWEIHGLKAKIDTGARTSALHVEDLKQLGPSWVEFYVVLSTKGPQHRRRVRAEVVKWAKVRSSTGDYKRRCFVKTHVKIGSTLKEIELSLVSREKMLFRMLLGRKALEKDFLVDVSKRGILGQRPAKKKAAGGGVPARKRHHPE